MPIEIEKKYRLNRKQREQVRALLPGIGAKRISEEFEENTIYTGGSLDIQRCVLRLRRAGKRATLTYKERFPTQLDIKHQREEETRVDRPEAMASILNAIGFTPALVYEKRRETWRLGKIEIVIDELPFGLFMEIEGSESAIREAEGKLSLKRLKWENATYPQLTRTHGIDQGGVIEARFSNHK